MLPSNASEFEAKEPLKKDGPRPSGGLFLTIGLLVVLVAVIAFAVTQMPTGPLSRPATASKPAAAAAPTQASAAKPGAPADAATQQAIQDVIRKADEAQAQAIATRDHNVMAATATPEFFTEQVTNNQDLLDHGVVEVKLINLEWGQITVNDNSATATVYETWSTTLNDGRTVQSRDRNVYTLIKDSARGWVVQAYDHPDQPASAGR
jgi:hypothetical protein